MVILSNKDRIDIEDLPASIGASAKKQRHPAWPLDDPSLAAAPLAAAAIEPADSSSGDESGLDLQQALEQLEFRLIDEALRLANGKKSAAAQLLRLKRTTLVAKLRKRRRTPLAAAVSANNRRDARQAAGLCGTGTHRDGAEGSAPADGSARAASLGYRRM
jgi:DNA-binding NtrC family response regulator